MSLLKLALSVALISSDAFAEHLCEGYGDQKARVAASQLVLPTCVAPQDVAATTRLGDLPASAASFLPDFRPGNRDQIRLVGAFRTEQWWLVAYVAGENPDNVTIMKFGMEPGSALQVFSSSLAHVCEDMTKLIQH